MKIQSRKAADPNKLPSRFQIGDRVIWVKRYHGEVKAVLFEDCKVWYYLQLDGRNYPQFVDSVEVEPMTCRNTERTMRWKCTRHAGHDGPCAAVPMSDEEWKAYRG